MPQRSDDEWRELLTSQQYYVCRKQGTEPAFSGELLNEHRAGKFVCVCCDTPLFDSTSKYDSGSGWPSFWQCLPGQVKERQDLSHNMQRIEVLCANCAAHLGHLFPDGPQLSGLRYCINSVALKFIPIETDDED